MTAAAKPNGPAMLARRLFPALAGLLFLAAALILAATRLDRPLMESIYFRPPALFPLARRLTQLGSLAVLIPASALGILFALRHHGADLAWRLGIGMAAAEGLTELVKLVLARTRPDFLHQVTARGASFPSGHSLNSIVVWSLLALVIASVGRRRKVWARLLFVLPLLVGWTRVYLGVHWPSDVLGGWGLGLLLVAAIAPLGTPSGVVGDLELSKSRSEGPFA